MTTTKPTTPRLPIKPEVERARDLARLADEIKTELQQVEHHARSAVEHAQRSASC